MALSARNGVLAAELARRGITGPSASIEGQAGFYAAFEPGDAELLLADLGHRYETEHAGIKKFPSCVCNHAPVRAAIDLGRSDAFAIDRIRVRVTPYMYTLVGGNFAPTINLQVAAQFSVRYSVACGIMCRQFRLADLGRERVLEPRVRALAEQVEIEVGPFNTGFLQPATVLVEAGGRDFERTVDVVPGSAQAPLSDAEVAEKFEDCVAHGAATGRRSMRSS